MTQGLFKAIALAAAAQKATANWMVYDMTYDWQFRYGDDCAIEVYKKTDGDKILVFSSDDQLLTTGLGSVDDKVIMKAGNITHFPFKESSSSRITCDQVTFNAKDTVQVSGSILLTEDSDGTTPSNSTPFSIEFVARDAHRFGFSAEADGANSEELGTNYLSMKYGSDNWEEFYGMGLQYTDWNFKGKQMPLITTEAGVGRGL